MSNHTAKTQKLQKCTMTSFSSGQDPDTEHPRNKKKEYARERMEGKMVAIFMYECMCCTTWRRNLELEIGRTRGYNRGIDTVLQFY